MDLKIKKLLKRHNLTTLKKLSLRLGVSLDKIKSISSGRTSFESLFLERKQYRFFPLHSKRLAELTGVVLGDGNISKMKRCQRLTISCNASYKKYIDYLSALVGNVLKKKPNIIRRSQANCADIYLYMQNIDKALALPIGNKIENAVTIPEWIFRDKLYLRRCLKGLFETDGHYGFSRKYHVEYIQFCNRCDNLRNSVFRALEKIGYSPQNGSNYIRLAKRAQVRRFIKEMNFLRPFPSLSN